MADWRGCLRNKRCADDLPAGSSLRGPMGKRREKHKRKRKSKDKRETGRFKDAAGGIHSDPFDRILSALARQRSGHRDND